MLIEHREELLSTQHCSTETQRHHGAELGRAFLSTQHCSTETIKIDAYKEDWSLFPHNTVLRKHAGGLSSLHPPARLSTQHCSTETEPFELRSFVFDIDFPHNTVLRKPIISPVPSETVTFAFHTTLFYGNRRWKNEARHRQNTFHTTLFYGNDKHVGGIEPPYDSFPHNTVLRKLGY